MPSKKALVLVQYKIHTYQEVHRAGYFIEFIEQDISVSVSVSKIGSGDLYW